MSSRTTQLVALVAVSAVVVGWWLFELQSAPEEPRSFPTIITGAAALLVAPALAGCHRRPSDTMPLALVTVALVVVAGFFRLLSPPWPAMIGAGASYLAAAPLLNLVNTRSSDRGRLAPTWAMWGVPVVLAGALISASGPTAGGEAGTRSSTWAVIERLESGRLAVERQPNPAALWPDAVSARALWLVWASWTIGLVGFVALRWWRRTDGRDRGSALALAAAATTAAAVVLASWPVDVHGILSSPSVVLDRWHTDIVVIAPALAAATVGMAAFWDELVIPRLTHSADGRMRLEQDVTAGGLRHQLVDLLADPTARVLFPTGDTSDDWVDEDGHIVPLTVSTGRGVAIVSRSGSPVAAIEHEAALSAQPDLVDIVATATSLALEQRSRRAAAEREAADVRKSAIRLLVAAERSREDLRHRISEGPDKRLEEVLGLIDCDQPPLDAVHGGLKVALDELRTIAHGELPLSLHEHGLPEAVADLSAETGATITLDPTSESPPSPERETLYLLIAEAAHGASQPVSCVLSRDIHGWCLDIRGVTSRPADRFDERLDDRLATLGATSQMIGETLRHVIPASDPMDLTP